MTDETAQKPAPNIAITGPISAAKWLAHDVKERPLRYVGPAYIVGDLILMGGGASDSNYYMLSAAGLGAVNNVFIMVGGDGGDPEKRTEAQNKRARLFQDTFCALTAVSGGLYAGSGIAGHGGQIVGSEIFIGAAVTAGGLVGLFAKPPKNPSLLKDIGKALLKGKFAESVKHATNLDPYKASAAMFACSTAAIVPAFLETHNPWYLVSFGVYAGANYLTGIAKKAELAQPTRDDIKSPAAEADKLIP